MPSVIKVKCIASWTETTALCWPYYHPAEALPLRWQDCKPYKWNKKVTFFFLFVLENVLPWYTGVMLLDDKANVVRMHTLRIRSCVLDKYICRLVILHSWFFFLLWILTCGLSKKIWWITTRCEGSMLLFFSCRFMDHMVMLRVIVSVTLSYVTPANLNERYRDSSSVILLSNIWGNCFYEV